MYKFKAPLSIIGVNPFVFVPEEILKELFEQSGKNKGYIPVLVTINGIKHKQTLVRYSGDWRLYINTKMLKNSPKRIAEVIELGIEHDSEDRVIEMHAGFLSVLEQNSEAREVYLNLPASRQKEIVRYISQLKSEESVVRNIEKAIGFLTGKNRFVGRDKP
jgi:hypothetical protein